MKKLTVPIILIIILSLSYINLDKISNKIAEFLLNEPEVIIKEANNYYRDYSFSYVKNVDEYIPYSYQHLLNIIFSTLNNGWETFTFYCPQEYPECVIDIKSISEDETLLTNINNFVHPFNSFTNIKTTYDNTGEVTLQITKLYNDYQIQQINNKVTSIISEVITDNMSDRDKIKAIHDYIINITTYDTQRNEEGTSPYKSNIAYGPLIEQKAVCGGYSDAMAIFLNIFNIKNYKIASTLHVWNGVYVDDEWLHLDLTWDDPIDPSGRDHLIYKYYLINSRELINLDTKNHNFDTMVYQEFKLS